MNPPPRSTSSRLVRPVLIISSDYRFAKSTALYLSAFDYEVKIVNTETEGLKKVLTRPWHTVILDGNLRGSNRLDLLNELRRTSTVPVLLVAERADDADVVAGIESGADDYLTKGTSTRQLMAHLRAVTRRAAMVPALFIDEMPVCEIVIAELHISLDARSAQLDGKTIRLTPGEFDLLVALAKAKGRVKTRDHLLEEIRERDYEVFDRAIDVQVSTLRRKLGDDPKEPRFIRTIRSAGYMLVDPNVATRF